MIFSLFFSPEHSIPNLYKVRLNIPARCIRCYEPGSGNGAGHRQNQWDLEWMLAQSRTGRSTKGDSDQCVWPAHHQQQSHKLAKVVMPGHSRRIKHAAKALAATAESAKGRGRGSAVMIKVVLTWRYRLSGLAGLARSNSRCPPTPDLNGPERWKLCASANPHASHRGTPPIEFLILVCHVRWMSALTTCALPSRCEDRRARRDSTKTSQAELTVALSHMQGKTRLGLCRKTSPKKKRCQTWHRVHGATPVPLCQRHPKMARKVRRTRRLVGSFTGHDGTIAMSTLPVPMPVAIVWSY